jgi:hypothetical protein
LCGVTKDAWLLCFVNYQSELPNVSVHDLTITFRLPGGAVPKVCRTVSDGKAVEFALRDGAATICLARLDTVEMIEIE